MVGLFVFALRGGALPLRARLHNSMMGFRLELIVANEGGLELMMGIAVKGLRWNLSGELGVGELIFNKEGRIVRGAVRQGGLNESSMFDKWRWKKK